MSKELGRIIPPAVLVAFSATSFSASAYGMITSNVTILLGALAWFLIGCVLSGIIYLLLKLE